MTRPLRPAGHCGAIALAGLLFCGCGRTTLTAARPHAVVDGKPIDFGSTPILFPVQRTVLVANTGRVMLHLTGLAVSGAGFGGPSGARDLEAGDTAQLALVFRPGESGSFAGAFSLATDDPDLPSVKIDLGGVATKPGALSVTPAALDFGRVGEGQTATRLLTMASDGPADLYLGGFTLPAAFGFVGSVTAPSTLAAGSSAKIGVRFSPSPGVAGAGGALVIESSDPSHPQLLVPLTASVNHAPLAVARASSTDAAVGTAIVLDGTASSDPDGDLPLTWAWSLVTRPEGSTATIAAPTAAQTSLRLDQPGIYSVLLSAIDSTGLPSFAPARVDLRASPPQALAVQLVWDQIDPDLDLHFLQAGAALQSAGDCYWANPSPPWGPHHQGDALTGYGPETVTWEAPASGQYDLRVIYAAGHGSPTPATTAQLRVYAQGVLVADLSHAFAKPGDAWFAGTLTWPGAQIGTTP